MTNKAALDYMYQKKNITTCDMFKYAVVINHMDGSHFYLENAFVEDYNCQCELIHGKLEIAMLLVYTEHSGYFAFFKEDLSSWRVLDYNAYNSQPDNSIQNYDGE